MKTFEIIIPAFNEEHRIEPMLRSYADYFSHHTDGNVTLHVVLNGCTDRTRQVVERIQEKHRSILLTEVVEPIGKGGAVLLGWQQSVADYVGFVDADGSTSPAEFDKLIQASSGYPAVIASRFVDDAIVHDRQSVLRTSMSRSFAWWTRLLFGMPYADTQCGAKLFQRSVLESVLAEMEHTDMSFDVELLWRLHKQNVEVYEVPTVWFDKPGSASLGTSSAFMMTGFRMLWRLIKLRFL